MLPSWRVVVLEDLRSNLLAQLCPPHRLGTGRRPLVAGGWRLADGRILDDSITSFRWGVAVASGRADLLAHVTQFLESAKRSGVVQKAIETYRVAGARVAR